ncbi:aldo/keto reductase, partial [bacterium]
QALSQDNGLNITQIALGYLLNQPFPVVPIVGSKNTEQLADTLSAADVKLTADQVDGLSEVKAGF